MKTIGTIAFFVLRLVCYVALAIVVCGIGAMVFVSMLDVCPTLHEGGISCNAPVYQHLAEFGMAVLLLTVFTGFPAFLAIGGVVFLARDIAHWRRRRQQPAMASDTVTVESMMQPAAIESAEPSTLGRVAKTALKVLLVLMAISLVGGVIFGLLDGL